MFGILISVIQVVSITTQKDNVSLIIYKHINSLHELPQSIDNLLLEIDRRCSAVKDFISKKSFDSVRDELNLLTKAMLGVINNLETKSMHAFEILSRLDVRTDKKCLESLVNRLKYLVDFLVGYKKSSSSFIHQEMSLRIDILEYSDRVVNGIDKYNKKIKAHFEDLGFKLMQILLDVIYYNTLSFYRPNECHVLMEPALEKTLIDNLPDNDDVLKECLISRYSRYKPMNSCFLKMFNETNLLINTDFCDLYRKFALEFHIEVDKQFKMNEFTEEKVLTALDKLYDSMLSAINIEEWYVLKGDEKNNQPFQDVFEVFQKSILNNFGVFAKGLNALLKKLINGDVLSVEELYNLVDKLVDKNMYDLKDFRNNICLINHYFILNILQCAVDDSDSKKKNVSDVVIDI